jgi:uncharacterized glyoxalase superfamily protein PhnB
MAITAYLHYEDVGSALKWLAKAFGFKSYGVRITGGDKRVNHAAMRFGDGLVMMGRPADPKFRNPKRLGQPTQSLYVNVENIDKHFSIARKAGARILEEPSETSYGDRRYGVEDPEGHRWYFAQEPKPKTRKRASRK